MSVDNFISINTDIYIDSLALQLVCLGCTVEWATIFIGMLAVTHRLALA